MAKIYSSGLVDSGQSFTFDSIDPQFNQLFVTASYFTDEDGDTTSTPVSGTVTVAGTPNGAGAADALSGSPLDCTSPSVFASTNVPLESIDITPSGIVGAGFYQITVTAKAN